MLKTLMSKVTNSKVWPSNHVNLNCASSNIIMFLLVSEYLPPIEQFKEYIAEEKNSA